MGLEQAWSLFQCAVLRDRLADKVMDECAEQEDVEMVGVTVRTVVTLVVGDLC